MNLQLRLLQGTFKRHDGASLGSNVTVHGSRFVIGSGPECHMRCPSSAISEYHCEILAEDSGTFVRDLSSESGTFLNGERISGKRPIVHGDRLKIGKLEFEVYATAPEPAAKPKKVDRVGENISEMLAKADEVDKSRRKHDPAARIFTPPATPQPAEPKEPEKKKFERPARKPPGKLPPPPKIVANSTVDAAEEVLKKFFEKPKQ